MPIRFKLHRAGVFGATCLSKPSVSIRMNVATRAMFCETTDTELQWHDMMALGAEGWFE